MSFSGSLQSFQSAWRKVMQAFSSALYVLSRCCILSADYQCLLVFTLAQTRTVARVQLGIRAFNSTVYQDTHLCTCKHKSWLADIFSLHYSLSLLSCPLSPLHYLSTIYCLLLLTLPRGAKHALSVPVCVLTCFVGVLFRLNLDVYVLSSRHFSAA